MFKSGCTGVFGAAALLAMSACANGSDGDAMVEKLDASADTREQTGVTTWELSSQRSGTRIVGVDRHGSTLVALEAVLGDTDFTLVRTAYDEHGNLLADDELLIDGEHGRPLSAAPGEAARAHFSPRWKAITVPPSQLITSMSADLGQVLDSSSVVVTTGGASGTKSPCEKARNQFVRAQAALQAAVDADRACEPSGYDRPRCQSYADAVNTAYDTLQSAYHTYMGACPNG